MITLRWGTVSAVVERVDGLARIEVDGEACVAFTSLTGPVEEGDVVLVNTQARDLALGSGGFDVLYANLTRGLGLPPDEDAHVISLPYTPGQAARRYVEEERAGADGLAGLPVVCCGLHSQVAPACAALAGRRVTYVQVGGGALPVPLSDTVRALRVRQLVATTMAVAPCFGGEQDCVSLAAALTIAAANGADAIVCSVGPGIVGTGTRWGHGGLAVAEAANVAAALGGTPVVAPRVSFADARPRHRGLSEHTRSALALCLGRVRVAWPDGLEPPDGIEVEPVDVSDWQRVCDGLELSHMGRGPREDPWFFAAAFAAGRLAAGERRQGTDPREP